jgi:hypothetical protein
MKHELALGAGVGSAVKLVPKQERVSILRSMRRKLEKSGNPKDREAVRSVFGSPWRGKLRRFKAPVPLPRMVEINGQKKILHYRVARNSDGLRKPLLNQDLVFPTPSNEDLLRHQVSSGGGSAISTSVARNEALRRGNGLHNHVEGVYATSPSDLMRAQREKTKQAMVNGEFNHEREITQIDGAGLLKERKYTATDPKANYPTHFRRVRELAARSVALVEMTSPR